MNNTIGLDEDPFTPDEFETHNENTVGSATTGTISFHSHPPVGAICRFECAES